MGYIYVCVCVCVCNIYHAPIYSFFVSYTPVYKTLSISDWILIQLPCLLQLLLDIITNT